jgi:cytochrome P450
MTDAAPGSIIHLDGPDHARLRRLLTPEFTVKRMRALREYVAGLIESHIDAMLAKGGPVDLYQDFALPIPSLVICELLGVPYADRDRFQTQSTILVSTDAEPARFGCASFSTRTPASARVSACWPRTAVDEAAVRCPALAIRVEG